MSSKPIRIDMNFPKVKNDTINYIGEAFETVMGELVNSQSRNGGAGFYQRDAERAKEFIESVIMPLFNLPLQDTPILAGFDDSDEDVVVAVKQ